MNRSGIRAVRKPSRSPVRFGWGCIAAIGFSYVLSTAYGIAQETASAAPANDFHIVCSLAKPVIDLSGSTTLDIYTDDSKPKSLTYEWTAQDGEFASSDPSDSQHWSKERNTSRAVWSPRGLQPGTYKVSAKVTKLSATPGGPPAMQSCSVTIVVSASVRSAQVGASGSRVGTYGYDTGRALLVKGQPQREGFGLYSYMLLGAPPDQAAKPRVLAFVRAYLELIADVKDLESEQSPKSLNLTYLPVIADPPEKLNAEWVLSHYDYGRARAILRSLPNARGRGPFILSALQQLDGSSVLPTPNLFEDLTNKPPDVVEFWVNQFLIQTTQQQFWQPSTLRLVALNLRTAIAYAAEGYPIVQQAVLSSIKLTPEK